MATTSKTAKERAEDARIKELARRVEQVRTKVWQIVAEDPTVSLYVSRTADKHGLRLTINREAQLESLEEGWTPPEQTSVVLNYAGYLALRDSLWDLDLHLSEEPAPAAVEEETVP